MEQYVPQWNEYANAVQAAVGDYGPIFQGGVFAPPKGVGYNETPFWNVENAVNFGMNHTKAKTLCDHEVCFSFLPSSGDIITQRH